MNITITDLVILAFLFATAVYVRHAVKQVYIPLIDKMKERNSDLIDRVRSLETLTRNTVDLETYQILLGQMTEEQLKQAKTVSDATKQMQLAVNQAEIYRSKAKEIVESMRHRDVGYKKQLHEYEKQVNLLNKSIDALKDAIIEIEFTYDQQLSAMNKNQRIMVKVINNLRQFLDSNGDLTLSGRLVQDMKSYLSMESFRDVVRDLFMDYEQLAGDTWQEKVETLVSEAERNGKMHTVASALKKRHPIYDWTEF